MIWFHLNFLALENLSFTEFKVTFKSFVPQFGFSIVLDLMKKYDPYHYIYESWGKDLGGNSWDVVFIFRKYLIWNF